MATTEQKLAAAGYSVLEAQEYVLAMVLMGNATQLAEKALWLGLDGQDLANLTGVSKKEVVNYFNASGVDGYLFNANQTGYVFLSNWAGEVYIANPVTGQHKLIYDFDFPVYDVATYKNGDIYILSDKLYRYDFSTGEFGQMSPVLTTGRMAEIIFDGDTLVRTYQGSNMLGYSTNFGANYTTEVLPTLYGDYPFSGDALAIVGDLVYRNEKRTQEHPNINAVTEYNKSTGETRVLFSTDKNMNLPYDEIINIGDNWLVAYHVSGVTAFNTATGDMIKNLPYPFDFDPEHSSNSDYVFGGTNALQMHVDAWGIPT